MINVEHSQIITYGHDQKATVYQDFADTNKYYIVPTPVIPLNDQGVPEFSLVRYQSNKEVRGVCAFQVELSVSSEALTAVKQHLGSVTIGQLDWQSAKAWFIFSAGGATLNKVVEPSMYGSNRAGFVIQLPNEVAVNAFINAFGPSGSAGGTFSLQYDVTTLTRLPPVKVMVEFDSNIAYHYEKTVHESENIWGNVTSRSVTIRQCLTESQAGKVTIDPGGKPLTPALRQRMLTWANQTLEADVDQAVGSAIKIIGEKNSDDFSMSQVASFKNFYEVGQVVPWYITPEAAIPSFDASIWSKIFSKVSDQNLRVSFTITNLVSNAVASVELTVTYPTKPTGNTNTFKPSTPGNWLFQAPGHILADGSYDGRYSYQYTVNYSGGSQPYKSPPISSLATEIQINANDLAILDVTFHAGNVAFAGSSGNSGSGSGNEVQSVLVDFYFLNQASGVVKNQQFTLDRSTTSYMVCSKMKLPFTNPYSYKLTYVLTDRQNLVIDWQQSNSNSQTITTPFQTVTVTPFFLAPADKEFDLVELQVTYSDKVNKIDEQHSWAVPGGVIPKPWSFQAPRNQNGQQIQFSGMFIIGGAQSPIPEAITSMPFINISTTQAWHSVEVFPSQIEWTSKKISEVVVNLYTLTGINNKTNIRSFSFNSKGPGKQLWGFLYDSQQTPVYYYDLHYWYTGEAEPGKITQTEVQGSGILVIPGNATS